MGHPTGFMEYTRAAAPYRDPVTRLGDWNEFVELPVAEDLARGRRAGSELKQVGAAKPHHTQAQEHLLIPRFRDRALFDLRPVGAPAGHNAVCRGKGFARHRDCRSVAKNEGRASRRPA